MIGLYVLQGFLDAARPRNLQLIDNVMVTQTKMHAPI
jgi:hypothetical protein